MTKQLREKQSSNIWSWIIIALIMIIIIAILSFHHLRLGES